VIIHADEPDTVEGSGQKRIESFVVGQDVTKGEKLQWIVEGGKYKASFLLPDHEGGKESESGLLISETVVPGFEYCDHDFLSKGGLKELVGEGNFEELKWLMSPLGAE
jgi:predicted cupin superfamily sugar epimerase